MCFLLHALGYHNPEDHPKLIDEPKSHAVDEHFVEIRRGSQPITTQEEDPNRDATSRQQHEQNDKDLEM